MSLASKIIAVTGGASGMGAATCRLLARQGAAAICIADLNSQNFASLQAELKAINKNTAVHTTKVDVSSSSAVASWIKDIVGTFGNLHGAANVAGLPQPVGVRKAPAILEETDETWRRTMGVNLDGIFYCTREQIRAMVNLPPAARSIVNVSSVASLRHTPDCYGYGISKVACAHFSESVAQDAAPFGIRVNVVSPGNTHFLIAVIRSRHTRQLMFLIIPAATDTPMWKDFFPGAKSKEEITEQMASMGISMLEASDVARTIGWLLSEDSDKVNGVNIPVGAGAA